MTPGAFSLLEAIVASPAGLCDDEVIAACGPIHTSIIAGRLRQLRAEGCIEIQMDAPNAPTRRNGQIVHGATLPGFQRVSRGWG